MSRTVLNVVSAHCRWRAPCPATYLVHASAQVQSREICSGTCGARAHYDVSMSADAERASPYIPAQPAMFTVVSLVVSSVAKLR